MPWMKFNFTGYKHEADLASEDTKGKSLKEILSHRESWAVVIGRFF